MVLTPKHHPHHQLTSGRVLTMVVVAYLQFALLMLAYGVWHLLLVVSIVGLGLGVVWLGTTRHARAPSGA